MWLEKVKGSVGGVGEGATEADGRPHIGVTILGKTFSALLDTGSVVNLISERVAEHLEINGIAPERKATILRMADGSRSSVVHCYKFKADIGGNPWAGEALLVPNLTSDLILGVGVIRDLGMAEYVAQVISSEVVDVVNYSGDEGEAGKEGMASSASTDLQQAREVEVTGKQDGDHQVGVDSGIATMTKACGQDHRGTVSALVPLGKDQESELDCFLQKELPLFMGMAGRTHLVEHEIRLKEGTVPIKQRHYPRNPAMAAIINREVEDMLKDGVIEPSSSPWSSPIVMVKKSAGKFRFCVDLRKVNESSVKDAYPLPRINAILEKLKQARFISTLDLYRGYWQVPLKESSRPITAFTIPGVGLFQFKVMPFGLHSAGATFQRLLDRVIGPDLEPKAFAYLDDLVLVTESFKEHLELLSIVFARLKEAGLRLNPDKCHFCKSELKYLGHIVSGAGIATDPEKVRAIQEFPTPKNVKNLRSFLGLASWYRRFVEGFATATRPLTKLLKKSTRWCWNSGQEEAFQELKRRLSSTPILSCPDWTQTFVLQVDASNDGLGAALTQNQAGREVVIAYASRLLSDQEKKYTTTEKEALALVWAVRKYRPYLEGYHFLAITDHVALRWLMKLQDPTGRLARWVMELQQHDFEVQYRKGALNQVADALSRIPVGTEEHESEVDIAVLEQNPTAGAENELTLDKAEGSSWYDRVLSKLQDGKRHFPNYCVRKGILYRLFGKDNQARVWKMCVPTNHIRDVLVENHDSPTAGHLGVKKTLCRVTENYFWPGWRRDVKEYVRSCPTCQAYKVSQQKPAGKMYFRNPQGPWHSISADLVGPFPRSKSGHRFLVVFQDQFSKWIELEPIRSATAKAVSAQFNRVILLRYGAPEILITDNGTQFTSRLFQKLTDEWEIDFRHTAPYSPQSNPVERPNRVIKTMIAQFVKDNHRSWDLLLGEFRYAVNTAVHDSTGFTPAKLCLGRELRLPRAVRGPLFSSGSSSQVGSDVPEERDMEQVYGEREVAFKKLYERCHQNLKRAFERQSRYYNLRRREVLYKPGDLVMRRLHVLSSAIEAKVGKLAPKFQGPCKVLQRVAANMYEVQNTVTSEVYTVHVKDLKTFNVRVDP